MKRTTLALIASAMMASCAPSYRDVIIPQPQVVETVKGSCPHDAEPAVTIDSSMEHGPESYELTIGKKGITIKAGGEAGAFYAQQSLDQLRKAYEGRLPAVKITDWPRFRYRGCHIDVSRHFWGKEVILKQIDMFARLKLNRIHLHLTDGAGWRMQIDAYPLLTQRAAFRSKSDIYEWEAENLPYCNEGDPDAYGGYYTKDDLREIIAYADSLHMIVIPEIEMFGHSNEVTAVYPQVGCKKDGTRCSVFCVGKEETFHFLETVLDEVMEVFPSEYIHIGGDEASKYYWKACPDCQARIRKEHLDGEDGLQSYGIKRMDEYVRSKGRKIIGWDEILEGGLAPGAVVMSWRGEEGGREAAAAGHEVIMTPSVFCYLDAVQNNPEHEPLGFGGMLPLPKIYSYDPAPAEMPGKEYVMGVQTSLWTEMIEKASHLEYMLYPRVFALSEIAWTDPGRKDYDSFYRRALDMSDTARELGYNVFDQRNADLAPEGYDQVFKHLAYGCKVEYLTPFHEKYVKHGGDETALTDGLIGGYSFKDRWQGYLNSDVSVIIDLGKPTTVSSVSSRFLQFRSIEVMHPEAIVIETSSDKEHFEKVCEISNELDWVNRNYTYKKFEWKADSPVETRYIRFTGKINDRRWGWILLDEIMVN